MGAYEWECQFGVALGTEWMAGAVREREDIASFPVLIAIPLGAVLRLCGLNPLHLTPVHQDIFDGKLVFQLNKRFKCLLSTNKKLSFHQIIKRPKYFGRKWKNVDLEMLLWCLLTSFSWVGWAPWPGYISHDASWSWTPRLSHLPSPPGKSMVPHGRCSLNREPSLSRGMGTQANSSTVPFKHCNRFSESTFFWFSSWNISILEFSQKIQKKFLYKK